MKNKALKIKEEEEARKIKKDEELTMAELHEKVIHEGMKNLDKNMKEEQGFIKDRMTRGMAQLSPVKKFLSHSEFSQEPRETSWEEYEDSRKEYEHNRDKKVCSLIG